MRQFIICAFLAAFLLAACSAASDVPAAPTLDAIQQEGQAVFKVR